MDYKFFRGKKVLITGATGLIGKALVKQLLCSGEQIKVVAVVRDAEKAKAVFANLPQENLEYIVTDIRSFKPRDIGADYVIHGVGVTASKAFVETPVEVIDVSLQGTKNLLEFAKVNKVKGFVFLSTMEVYGAPSDSSPVYENSPSFTDTMAARSSYPESKRLCESLCYAYFSECGVPIRVARLTQTFGEGVEYNDGRVFAEFARCAIEGRDIVLKTKGETERNYLCVSDAASAIFTILARGKVGEAYNVANEATYCSIRDMAQMAAKEFGGGKIKVVINAENVEKCGYAPPLKMNLNADKLKSLGWQPRVGLKETFAEMIEYMKAQKNKPE